jgi:broad specificity phosphatase PhoE
VLVAHSGVMKLCAAELAGVPASEWFSMRFDYGTASLIEANLFEASPFEASFFEASHHGSLVCCLG